jgi:C4-dicarboxylate-specific signal transduction histidine kinase
MKIANMPGFRYGVALLFIAAALALSLLVQPFLPHGFLILFLCAVMLAGWFGRIASGILTVVVSMAAVDYFFIAPYGAFVGQLDELSYFLSFLLSAVVGSWLASARRSAQALQSGHLDKSFGQSSDAIVLADRQDQIRRVNRSFMLGFDQTAYEISDSLSTDLSSPEPLQTEAPWIRQQPANGEHVHLETVRLRNDGIAYDLSLRDISESGLASEKLQKAHAELARLSRITMMRELTATIAHEINQPIGAMVTNGYAAKRWLAKQPPNMQEAEEALDCIVRDGHRVAEVVKKIRSLLTKGSTPMVLVDVNEIIREVLVLTSHEFKRHGITVVTEFGTHLPSVVGDRVQLQQVMFNLVMNSLDAMTPIPGRPRELHIRSSDANDYLLTQVLDCGCGLPNTMDSIFDPFFTTKDDAIGMGLTISRSIIESHRGRLWAENRSPHGAILSFTLPIGSRAD